MQHIKNVQCALHEQVEVWIIHSVYLLNMYVMGLFEALGMLAVDKKDMAPGRGPFLFQLEWIVYPCFPLLFIS